MSLALNPQVFFHAAELIEGEGKWTQRATAKNRYGFTTTYASKDAHCFCMQGAVLRSAQDLKELSTPHWHFVCEQIAQPVTFNDAADRTQAEVVAKLREIGQLAEVHA